MIRILLSSRMGEKRINQAELSRKTGIRPGTINELYHEITDRVSLSQLEKICDALNCDLSDLIAKDPDNFKNTH